MGEEADGERRGGDRWLISDERKAGVMRDWER